MAILFEYNSNIRAAYIRDNSVAKWAPNRRIKLYFRR